MSNMRNEYEALLAELVTELQRSQASVPNLGSMRNNIISIVDALYYNRSQTAPVWPEESPAP